MKRSLLSALAVVGFAAGVSNATVAIFCTGFEQDSYFPGLLTGQDGWTLPAGVDYNVAAYGGGIATNPFGENQYAFGATSTDFARGQHTVPFEAGVQYRIEYDVNPLAWSNKPPAFDNIGSFSLQNSTTSRTTQSLFTWQDLNNPAAGWRSLVIAFDAAGTQLGFISPGAAWDNLPTNHWFRQSMVVDFNTNQLLSVSITDLTTMVTTTTAFADVYLGGGANNVGGRPMPDAIRMFTGGPAPIVTGNAVAWDNVCITEVPAPAAGTLALVGLGALIRRRRN